MIKLPVLSLLLCLLRLAERFCDEAGFAAQLQGLVQTYGRAVCSGLSEVVACVGPGQQNQE